MMSRKYLLKMGVSLYLGAFFLIIPVGFILLIVTPDVSDFEIFSYLLFSSLLMYGGGIIIYALIILIVKPEWINRYMLIFIMIFSVELIYFIFNADFFFIAVSNSIIKFQNYSLLGIYLALLASYIINVFLLKFYFSIEGTTLE